MNTAEAVPRLVLVPTEPGWHAGAACLADWARDMELAGAPIDERHFQAGTAFLSLLSFLGCSPTVSFEPPDAEAVGSGRFYHLRMLALDRPVFRADSFTHAPRCPHCRTRLDDWRRWWPAGSEPKAHDCTGCGQALSPQRLNWRRSAGVGRCFIEILGIHAGTVQPTDALFAGLAERSGTGWGHFFVQDAVAS